MNSFTSSEKIAVKSFLPGKRTGQWWTIAFLVSSLIVGITRTGFAASTTGAIQGKVYDAVTQEPLLGAAVIILATQRGTAADELGVFSLDNLPPGSYRLQASYLGYQALLKTDVIVLPGRQTEIMFALQPAAVQLSEVTVKPTYFTGSSRAEVSSQSLSYEEVRRSPGGQEDVVRAISVLPGVVQTTAGRNDLIVRGGAPSENLYMIDNLEVPNINHFGTQGATGGPLSFVNLDFVRDVTFSTGGFDAKYGDKLSSVLNIEIEDGRTDRIGGKLNLSATQFGLNAEGPLSRKGSFLFSARRSYLDYFFRAAGFGFVPEYWDFLAKTTHRIDSRNEFSTLTIGVLDNVRFFNETADQRYDNSRVLGSSQNQYYSDFEWRHTFRGGFVRTSLGRTFSKYDYEQADSLGRSLFASASREGQTSLRSDAVFRLGSKTELSFGAQGKLAQLDGSLKLFDSQTDFGDSLTASRTDWNTSGFKSAGYLQGSYAAAPWLRIKTGVRVDGFDMIQNRTVVSPRASARLQLARHTAFNISGGTYYQAPSYIWLASNPDNRRLRHLRADQIVAGVEQLLREDTRLRVEVYRKNYTDYPVSLDRPYLVLSNTGAGFGGSEEGYASFGFDPLVSRATGYSQGVEFLAQKKFSEIRCYGIASLTLSKTEFTGLDGIRRRGAFDQPVIFNLSGGYKPDDRWEFGTRFRLGSGTPYTPIQADGTRNVSDYNRDRLPWNHSLDVRIDRHWSFNGWSLITYLDIQNIYSRKNVQRYRWDDREQTVITEDGLGILPSLGISAEF